MRIFEVFDPDAARKLFAWKCEGMLKRVQAGVRSPNFFEPWIGGLALKISESPQVFYENCSTPEMFEEALSLLYEFAAEKEEKFISSLHFRQWLLNPEPAFEKEALDRLLNSILKAFQNDCHETWRCREGTFSHAYRECQNRLRKYLPSLNWKLYPEEGPMSAKFYAPAAVRNGAEEIGESDAGSLKDIPLPGDAPAEKDLNARKNLANLAIYFHKYLAHANALESMGLKLAVRVFVLWLCGKYALLDHNLLPRYGDGPAEDADRPEPTAPQALALDVETEAYLMECAKNVALGMGCEMRRLFRAKYVDNLSDNECMERLAYSSAKTVARRTEELRNYLRDNMNRIPLIFDARDEDGHSFRPPSTIYGEFFITSLQSQAEKEPYV